LNVQARQPLSMPRFPPFTARTTQVVAWRVQRARHPGAIAAHGGAAGVQQQRFVVVKNHVF
tara:strand:- start:659 stop:841 length:183 start_codon:yes stop_codon:yes gene_type:complete